MLSLRVRPSLPHFLPSEPSIFADSLCDAAMAALTAGKQRIAAPNSSAPPQTLREATEALTALYTQLFERLQEPESRAEAAAKRLTDWGVWEMYPRTMLPMTLERALLPLRGIATAFPEIEPALRQGNIPPNIVFRSAWRFFCFRYGYRCRYEGDIALPRFAEVPQATFADALALQPLRQYDDEFPDVPALTFKARLLSVVWQRYVAAQQEIETERSETMKRVLPLRQAILAQAEMLVQQGRLESPSAIWNVSVQECASM
jgi:hypothetical protein